MKAYSLHNVKNLVYENVKEPDCQSNWCIVKVKAAGICSSDIPRIFIKGTYRFPTIPGHEFSGIVYAVSDVKDKNWIGKRVGVFPLIPCKKCEFCKTGHYEMCDNYDYIGSRRNGGFSEYVAVPIWNLIELPDNVSFKEGAMMEPLSVALHAINQSKLQPNMSVGIIGTGTIAFAAAQWAKAKGASKICIIGRSEKKRELAKSINIHYTLLEVCNDEFDIVIEAVGSEDAINKSISLTKPAGRLVLMGNPQGDITLKQDIYWRILRKQINVVGTWNSSYESQKYSEWMEVKEALATGQIKAEKLITHIFNQDKLIDGLNLMKEHKEMYCKVMTLWNCEED